MVNKESLPLILALFVPITLAIVILLYVYGYDITLFLRKIDLIYYIIILPIALGFTAGLIKFLKKS